METKTQNFLTVVESNKGIIYKVANSYCKDGETRRDLIQEIVLQLWLSFDKYDPAFKLTTWMYRIALNVSISSYRKENLRSTISHPITDEIIYLRGEDTSGRKDDDVEQLHRFVRELKEIDRAIMLLYLDERPYREIADILGLTETNVSTRISRTKEQLRQNFSRINN